MFLTKMFCIKFHIWALILKKNRKFQILEIEVSKWVIVTQASKKLNDTCPKPKILLKDVKFIKTKRHEGPAL